MCSVQLYIDCNYSNLPNNCVGLFNRVVADFSEINKHVGLNKAVQEGFFLIYIGKNQVLKEKSQKIINM